MPSICHVATICYLCIRPITFTILTNMQSNIQTADRRGWVDALRVLACFMVVFSHCCDGFVGCFDLESPSFITGVALGSLVRPCVPLFVMMTAVLILPIRPNTSLGNFYRRRIGRILPPLIFWSIALPVMFYIYFALINPAAANPMVDTGNYTTPTLLQKIALMVFNFNFDTVPLWYLYMLVGLYLIAPIVNAWLVSADKRDIETVIKIWIFTLFIPYIKLLAPYIGYEGNWDNMEIFGGCDWNIYGTFYYISGFIGYMILAFYLQKWPLQWSKLKTAIIGVTMFLTGFVITFAGYLAVQKVHPGDYAFLEVIWYFTGINVFMMTFPIFVWFSRMKFAAPRWLTQLARLTFGVYLCHFVFVYITYELFDIRSWHPAMRIAAMALTSFSIAAALTWVIRLWRPTRRFVD